MRYVPVFILTVIMLSAAAPVYPHTGEVSIEVVSERGTTFLSIPHQDFWKGGTHILKKYLEARKGENYGIVIRNRTPERVGVVIAVDGRNIISGKKSDLKNNEAMYLVSGFEHARYDGWRTDKDTVHRFYFTEMADSYAMRAFSDSTSMGVIAVAVYREKERPKPLHEQKRQSRESAAPSAESSLRSKSGAVKDEATGTGFGDAQYSPTIKVAFEPESNPLQKMLVKYEWREVLCRKGILSCGQQMGNRLWSKDEYAPYPPRYPRN